MLVALLLSELALNFKFERANISYCEMVLIDENCRLINSRLLKRSNIFGHHP